MVRKHLGLSEQQKIEECSEIPSHDQGRSELLLVAKMTLPRGEFPEFQFGAGLCRRLLEPPKSTESHGQTRAFQSQSNAHCSQCRQGG